MMANLNFDKFLEFSSELNGQFINDEEVFSLKLLTLFEKHLNYSHCGITIYNNDYQLIDAISNNSIDNLKEYYLKSFYQRDALASYITNNICKIHPRDSKVIRGSDVCSSQISSRKDFEEYKDFLGIAGMSYIAVLPFDKFRICIYKTAREGDFSPYETEFLSFIGQFLQSIVPLKQYVLTLKSCSKLKNSFLDNQHIGLVVLDDDFEVLEFNELASEYLNSLIKFSKISDFFRNFIMLDSPFETAEFNKECKLLSINGLEFKIFIKPYFDSYNFLRRQYLITITNSSISKNCANYKKITEKFQISNRELEIIQLLLENLAYSEIAASLYISINTVRTHIKNIYRKLGINNQRELFRIFNK
jgi:DNA-binding CsgD family transcriptional regulator